MFSVIDKNLFDNLYEVQWKLQIVWICHLVNTIVLFVGSIF